MRSLASIQRITALEPIKGADRIVVARVLGWDVVVQKGLYEVGDLVVYFEIDSILPDRPWCEFMRDRKFRVKTIKLRKQISQGLCVPIGECLPQATYNEGMDVTDMLGVTKHDPEGDKERAGNVSGRQPIPHAWMIRFGITRKLHQMIYPRKKGSWPEWFPKTDETRVQNITHLEDKTDGRDLYVTEKLDGQSCTVFYNRLEKVGLFKKGLFGVCSRNIWYKTDVSNNWWNVAKVEDLPVCLPEYCDMKGISLAIQGEICGPGIQGNKYGLEFHELFVYSVFNIEEGTYLDYTQKRYVCEALNLQQVPLVKTHVRTNSCDIWVEYAKGKSKLKPTVEREGIVVRDSNDDSFSFKAISNNFLLKNE